MADYEIIESRKDLEALAKSLLSEPVVAFDTEADSFYHYFDKTCLVQVATRKNVWLIDPLTIEGPEKLAPLGKVLRAPKVQKVFHAAEYDIFVLKREFDFKFKNLFDTMISAQLLGYPGLGLAALVKRHFNIELPKDEQRSDWSQRPLRIQQLDYAAADVIHLIELAEILTDALKHANRLEWAQEEFELLTQREWPERQFDKLGYLKIKGARTLDPTALAILRELFLMRDKKAREIDRPSFKVLGNRTMLEIVESKPRSLDALRKIKGITEFILRRSGDSILEAIEVGLHKPHGPIPKINNSTPHRKRMDRQAERRFEELKRWRTGCAGRVQLDPGVLCPNAALEAIAIRNPKQKQDLSELPELKQWFVSEFGEHILDVLEAGHKDKAKSLQQTTTEIQEDPNVVA